MRFIFSDRRLVRIAGGLGAMFSAATVIGTALKNNGSFASFSMGSAMKTLALFMLLTLGYGALLFALFPFYQLWSFYAQLDEHFPEMLRLWTKLGMRHPLTYAEAFSVRIFLIFYHCQI